MPQKMYKDLFQPISITSTKEIKEAISPKAHRPNADHNDDDQQELGDNK